uniref:Ribonuclease H n=1 Tax=Macrostomum lignano TaxID=282301 RepID=A0A1I8IAH3_9PLAT
AWWGRTCPPCAAGSRGPAPSRTSGFWPEAKEGSSSPSRGTCNASSCQRWCSRPGCRPSARGCSGLGRRCSQSPGGSPCRPGSWSRSSAPASTLPSPHLRHPRPLRQHRRPHRPHRHRRRTRPGLQWNRRRRFRSWHRERKRGRGPAGRNAWLTL